MILLGTVGNLVYPQVLAHNRSDTTNLLAIFLGTANGSVCLPQGRDYLAQGERRSLCKQTSGCFEPKQ